MLEVKNYITKKYEQGNDSIETLISLINDFVAETYGSSVAVDGDSIETIEKLHAYIDVFYSEILEDTLLIKKFNHIFYITAEQINGKATFTGPDRKTAVGMLDAVKSSLVSAGEIKLMGIIAKRLSRVAEIQMSLTPILEILRELMDKNRIVLVSTKKSDMKRLKYFNEINDLKIFSYEFRYDACIIEPGIEFSSTASSGIESLFSYVMSHKISYMSNISSIKPYLRTAYSYYSICELAGSPMEISMETLRDEYLKLYNRQPDLLKFKNYVEALCDSDIFTNVNNKIKGIDKIFKNFIEK